LATLKLLLFQDQKNSNGSAVECVGTTVSCSAGRTVERRDDTDRLQTFLQPRSPGHADVAAASSATSLYFCQTTRRHNRVDSNLHVPRYDKLKLQPQFSNPTPLEKKFELKALGKHVLCNHRRFRWQIYTFGGHFGPDIDCTFPVIKSRSM